MSRKSKNTDKPRIDSVLSPPALNVTQCELPDIDIDGQKATSESLERMKVKNVNLWIFADIQLRAGLRVTELLRVRATEIDTMGRLKVKGLKGSEDRVVDTGQHSTLIAQYAKLGFTIWATWSRFYVYREYKKYGLGLDIEGNVRRAVTHSLRHMSARLLQDQTDSLSHAKALLGHVNVSNTETYVGKASAVTRSDKKEPSSKKAAKGDHSGSKEQHSEDQANRSEKKKKVT